MSIAELDLHGKRDARRDFLHALFGSLPGELFLELRCIHPTTGETRQLWGKLGDKAGLKASFQQADALNQAGYGVFFAPCPRRDKQGKAEAARVVPALWIDIDCEGDADSKAQTLATLRAFKPLPTALIDSGGGVHAYWLLSEPFSLNDGIDRERAAAVLRGLFALLGGDPVYPKSVASLMRLPDTHNTKPEREGAVVTILDFEPERRFPFADFEAFAQTLKTKRGAQVFGLDRQPSLPSRTERYLVSGAPEGSRNNELFAAACQLRDAGFTQAEAEAQLIPRHIADGGSEREAHQTIASAYSRPPRDPVEGVTPTAQVDALVSRFTHTERDAARPTVAQISAVVKACASLNAVEWAAERQRLKAVCGDGLKIADLDRLYREARRERQPDAHEDAGDSETYTERDGTMVYERQTQRGVIRQTVADWHGKVLEALTLVDDEAQVEHLSRVQFVKGTKALTLDVPDELFGDPNGLARFIAGRAGSAFSPRAGMHKHLAPAILRLSGETVERRTYRFMGWTQAEERWLYVSPELTVTANGILDPTPEVELEHRLRDYGLKGALWDEALAAFRAVIGVFPASLAPALLAFTLLPVVQRFLPSSAPKPALHLVGTTGSGKSEIAALMTSFYGLFHRDAPPAQWGDTVNTVETLGYALADALYWVDDYKTCYADEKVFTRFLQSYSRGMGRGRLTREVRLRQERACRGLLLSTGETTLEGEASVLSRMLVLDVPPWEQRDPGGKVLAHAEGLRPYLPAFTMAFIAWLARKADAGTLKSSLARRYAQNVAGYRNVLQARLGRQANTGRMIETWAVLSTVFQLLFEFLVERDADDMLPLWQDAIVETVKAVQQERAGRVFLDLLGQLLAGGQCVIEDDLRQPQDHASGTIVIGYRDEGFVYLLPDIALREINRTHPLKFSKLAIGNQLREDDVLIPGKDNLTMQRSVRGSVVRLWRLKAESLGCEGCESCETGE
jgi:hypothetical protein